MDLRRRRKAVRRRLILRRLQGGGAGVQRLLLLRRRGARRPFPPSGRRVGRRAVICEVASADAMLTIAPRVAQRSMPLQLHRLVGFASFARVDPAGGGHLVGQLPGDVLRRPRLTSPVRPRLLTRATAAAGGVQGLSKPERRVLAVVGLAARRRVHCRRTAVTPETGRNTPLFIRAFSLRLLRESIIMRSSYLSTIVV